MLSFLLTGFVLSLGAAVAGFWGAESLVDFIAQPKHHGITLAVFDPSEPFYLCLRCGQASALAILASIASAWLCAREHRAGVLLRQMMIFVALLLTTALALAFFYRQNFSLLVAQARQLPLPLKLDMVPLQDVPAARIPLISGAIVLMVAVFFRFIVSSKWAPFEALPRGSTGL